MLANKVITAKAISILVATILSYILNREWSFSRRGGREKHHEAMLFFLVNGIALGLNLVPLALSQYVFGFRHPPIHSLTVSIANFISANVIGTILGMAFRFWAYRKWVFPEELTAAPGTAGRSPCARRKRCRRTARQKPRPTGGQRQAPACRSPDVTLMSVDVPTVDLQVPPRDNAVARLQQAPPVRDAVPGAPVAVVAPGASRSDPPVQRRPVR